MLRIAPIVACVYELLKLGYEENLLLCEMDDTPKILESFLAMNPAEAYQDGPDGFAFYDNNEPECQALLIWTDGLWVAARFDENAKPVLIEVQLPDELLEVLGYFDALAPSTAEIQLLKEYLLTNKDQQPSCLTID